jgi:hypothetical protein
MSFLHLEMSVASGIKNCQSAVTRTTRESMKNVLFVRWQHLLHEKRVQIHLPPILECIAIHMDIMSTMVTQFGIVTSYHKV